jgi:parallel beta-helix repeat protein
MWLFFSKLILFINQKEPFNLNMIVMKAIKLEFNLMQKNVFIFVCTFIFLLLSCIAQHTSSTQILHQTKISRSITLNEKVVHEPIIISGDSDFKEQGWPGDGTVGNPYKIENLLIETDGNCISVYNTKSFFMINDCYLSSHSSWIDAGINLDRVDNCTIRNCVIQGKKVGIQLLLSSRCNITNNCMQNCSEDGIGIYNSEHISVNTCKIGDTGGSAIVVYVSNDIDIIENGIIDSNSDGVRIDGVSYIRVNKNKIARSRGYGFSCFETQNLTLEKCNITSAELGGIEMEQCRTSSAIECEIHDVGTGILFLRSEDSNAFRNHVFESIGSAIASFSSTGVTISENKINDCREGISVWEGSSECTIVNNTIHNMHIDGIKVYDSWNFIIQHNSVLNPAKDGLELFECVNMSIVGNQFSWFNNGLGLDGTRITSCQNIEIFSNGIFNSYYAGIHVYENSSQIYIAWNVINGSQSEGIWLSNCSYLELVGNFIERSSTHNLKVEDSHKLVVRWNRISLSGTFGLFLNSSNNLEISLNAFLVNRLKHVHVNNSDNIVWYNGTHGNYWDDYAGNDTNYDGIGDASYQISTEWTDPYPLIDLSILEEYWQSQEYWSIDDNNVSPIDQLNLVEFDEALIEILLIISPPIQMAALVILYLELRRKGFSLRD